MAELIIRALRDALKWAVFETYAALAEEGAKRGTEQERRESALQGIDEILEWRPLSTFSATHLELLELLNRDRAASLAVVETAPNFYRGSSEGGKR
jgi:hypothetical protein